MFWMCTQRNLETCFTKHSSIFSYWAYSVIDIEAYKPLKIVILHQCVTCMYCKKF